MEVGCGVGGGGGDGRERREGGGGVLNTGDGEGGVWCCKAPAWGEWVRR